MNIKSKGFTLIELLVVVAIIGILATVVLSSLSSARESARDAKRLSDIKTIQTALEMYANDNSGRYPIPPTSWAGSHTNTWSTLETALGITLPVDPLNTSDDTDNSAARGGEYVYTYLSINNSGWCYGRSYMLIFNLEGKNGSGDNDGVRSCGGLFDYNDAFVVGMNADGSLTTPDLSGQ